jgi:hypothetical protein
MTDAPTPACKPQRKKKQTRSQQAQAVSPGVLRDEIETLRGLLQQAAALSSENLTLEDQLDILDTVSKASTRLAGLLKAERSLEQPADQQFDLKLIAAEAARRLREGPEKFRDEED